MPSKNTIACVEAGSRWVRFLAPSDELLRGWLSCWSCSQSERDVTRVFSVYSSVKRLWCSSALKSFSATVEDKGHLSVKGFRRMCQVSCLKKWRLWWLKFSRRKDLSKRDGILLYNLIQLVILESIYFFVLKCWPFYPNQMWQTALRYDCFPEQCRRLKFNNPHLNFIKKTSFTWFKKNKLLLSTHVMPICNCGVFN